MTNPVPRTPAASEAALAAWSRRRLLGALAAGSTGALLTRFPGRANAAAATGTEYVPGSGRLSVQTWDPERVAREMAVLHEDLHCNAVTMFGSEPGRLREGAEIALREGLRVWLQPRPIDADAARLHTVITEVATAAEDLLQTYGPVGLNLGVEWTIFSAGIIPGATYTDRLGTLVSTFDQIPEYDTELNNLLASLRETARAAFSGPLTYGSGEWETVDWTDFDFVGVDLYLNSRNRATYREQVQALHASGKPVLITEFGCCSYEGAEDAGGAGFIIVDWAAEPPRLNGAYVRSEQVQADTITTLIDIYEAEHIHGAYVFTFIQPELTYDPDPLYDLDMASFGIVKALPAATGQGYEETGYWEPKLAFTEIATKYRQD